MHRKLRQNFATIWVVALVERNASPLAGNRGRS